ncbi:hypothetical protein CKA38_12675 [Ereboglobus luteus]|uniref:Uncharacterized protein n=2 Tax=Ereboglobus luteus TaxID=1796921 RepID=A0A2U8E599_9BACT|nr:hypothetical protein CKA38_12675 [Ereboglobus luteus]
MAQHVALFNAAMSSFDPNNPSDSDDDDVGGVAWNEFDWEHYLREQDDTIHRYIGFYELLLRDENRLEKAAAHMGWRLSSNEADDDDDDDEDDDQGPYTVHKNYIYVALRAIHLKLTREWERIAMNPASVPQPLAVAFSGALHRGESHAVLAVHALDFGDFAMAVSLFKRMFGEINRAIAILDEKAARHSTVLAKYRTEALCMLFDLREISLRMMEDCRGAIELPAEDDFD